MLDGRYTLPSSALYTPTRDKLQATRATCCSLVWTQSYFHPLPSSSLCGGRTVSSCVQFPGKRPAVSTVDFFNPRLWLCLMVFCLVLLIIFYIDYLSAGQQSTVFNCLFGFHKLMDFICVQLQTLWSLLRDQFFFLKDGNLFALCLNFSCLEWRCGTAGSNAASELQDRVTVCVKFHMFFPGPCGFLWISSDLQKHVSRWIGNSKLVKMLDYWWVGHEFKSQHCKAGSAGALSKALNPQFLICVNE